jgi:hypothetical protein
MAQSRIQRPRDKPQDLERREKLLVPRVGGRADVASATRRPWIDSNGWRFVRKPSRKFFCDLSEKGGGQAVLAIAEAFAVSSRRGFEDRSIGSGAGRQNAELPSHPLCRKSPRSSPTSV